MNSVAEALNTLIGAVNIAHNKGGVYNMEETHHIYMAISFLNNLSQQPASEAAAPAAPETPVEVVEETTPTPPPTQAG